MGLIIDGIAASSAIDTSSESIDIEGIDISSLEAGHGTLNFEHKNAKQPGSSFLDTLGAITFAKKIFGPKDCDDDRQLRYWEQIELPFVYIRAELFDGEGHAGAQAAASIIRYYDKRKIPILMRFSIDGLTVERDGNILKRCIARDVALTLKPCNHSCVSGVVEEKAKPSGGIDELSRSEAGLVRFPGVEFTMMNSAAPQPVELLRSEVSNIQDMLKAMTAGGGNVAPDALRQGAALAREDVKSLAPRLTTGFRDWNRRTPLIDHLKKTLSDVHPDFLQKFVDLITEARLRKASELHAYLEKTMSSEDREAQIAALPPAFPGSENDRLDAFGRSNEATSAEGPNAKARQQAKTMKPPAAPKLSLEQQISQLGPAFPTVPDEDPEQLPHVPGLRVGVHPAHASRLDREAAIAALPQAPSPHDFDKAEKPIEEPKPLTIGGTPLKGNEGLRSPYFDENAGVLHTEQGSFPMYIPSRDSKASRDSFHEILNSPKVNEFHDYAVRNWARLHDRLKSGNIPAPVVMHATLFSQLSPNCLDAETEALTQRGWVKGFDLKPSDILLTKNPKNGQLEWQKPTDIKLFPDYEGELVAISTRSFEVVTTPEHRWLITSTRDHVAEKTSTTLATGDRIHRTGEYCAPRLSGLTPDEAEILGWFVTDGFYQRAKSCDGSRAHRAKFETPGVYAYLCQSQVGNPAKVARIDRLLSCFSEVKRSVEPTGKVRWGLGPKLTKMLLNRAPERCLTVRSLLDLGQESLARLAESMYLGDGNSWSGKGWKVKKQLTTGRQEQAGAFQVLLTMLGKASSCFYRDMSGYEPQSEKMANVPKMTGVFIVTELAREYVCFDPRSRTVSNDKRGVWCPMVPNTFFVARRKGQVFITGNTPVPVQELMYGHLVDHMKDTGVDARDPAFADTKQAWLDRDQPQQGPQHSPDHWKRLGRQITINSTDERDDGRGKGDYRKFALANNKWKNMAKYHAIHDRLMGIVNGNRDDVRKSVRELMMEKTRGAGIPGLAPKTARYMMGMLGGGNVVVPDTHFIRYLFGLHRAKDRKSIEYLKRVLWRDTVPGANTLDAIDRYYFRHHDAVKHMLSHPEHGKLFEKNPESAIFPAFWKNWVSIVPHEQTRGLATRGHNEGTDHKPFWEAAAPFLKSEQVVEPGEAPPSPHWDLASRTAEQHAKWVDEYGEAPAMLLYAMHLLPLLMNAEAVQKSEAEAQPASHMPAPPPEVVKIRGKAVHPGQLRYRFDLGHELAGKTFKVVASEPQHYEVLSGAGPTAKLQKVPKALRDKAYEVLQEPLPARQEKLLSEGHLSHASRGPEQLALAGRIDLSHDKKPVNRGSHHRSGKTPWLQGTPAVFVKPSMENMGSDLDSATAETAFYNAARDVFGLGHLVPPTISFWHPESGQLHSAQDFVAGGRHASGQRGVSAWHQQGLTPKMAVMDYVLGNNDRWVKNWLRAPNGEPRLIDHGNAFGYRSAVTPDYINVKDWRSPWGQETLNWLQGLDPHALESVLRRSGVHADGRQHAVRRLGQLKARLAAGQPLTYNDLLEP